MQSIVELVAQAESQAAQVRREAQQQARDRIAQATAQGQDTVRKAQEQAREIQADAARKAEHIGAILMDQIREEKEAQAQSLCDAARTKLNEAVNHILEGVETA